MDIHSYIENEHIIERYFHGQLSDSDTNFFVEHFNQCKSCRIALAEVEANHQQPQGVLDESGASRTGRRSFPQMATAVLVIFLFLSWRNITPRQAPNAQTILVSLEENEALKVAMALNSPALECHIRLEGNAWRAVLWDEDHQQRLFETEGQIMGNSTRILLPAESLEYDRYQLEVSVSESLDSEFKLHGTYNLKIL